MVNAQSGAAVKTACYHRPSVFPSRSRRRQIRVRRAAVAFRERTTPVPKTAEIIAHALHEEGVRHAFGIPGGEVLELLEAFRKAGIKFILTKHEMGAGIMAEASYQLTVSPGVLVATLGPGIANTVNAVAQSSLDQIGRAHV